MIIKPVIIRNEVFVNIDYSYDDLATRIFMIDLISDPVAPLKYLTTPGEKCFYVGPKLVDTIITGSTWEDKEFEAEYVILSEKSRKNTFDAGIRLRNKIDKMAFNLLCKKCPKKHTLNRQDVDAEGMCSAFAFIESYGYGQRCDKVIMHPDVFKEYVKNSTYFDEQKGYAGFQGHIWTAEVYISPIMSKKRILFTGDPTYLGAIPIYHTEDEWGSIYDSMTYTSENGQHQATMKTNMVLMNNKEIAQIILK